MDIPVVSSGPAGCQPAVINIAHQGAAASGSFHVNDRVERLTGESEQSHWGTITSVVDLRDAKGEWLVLDNAGVTHTDRSIDLLPAARRS
jgi:hypothetical protein